MYMGPDIIHDQDEPCMRGQGRPPDERFSWQCSAARKRPSPEYKVFCERNKKNRNEGRREGVGKRESTQMKFHEARQKAEEEAAATGAPMLDDLQFMATISSGLSCCRFVCAAFDEHMGQFANQSHFSYTPMPPMMDIIRATMTVVPSISSLMSAAARTSDARVSSSTPPPFSIDAPGTSTVDPPPLLPSLSPPLSSEVKDPEDGLSGLFY
ncbi:hypothetical protein M9H77_21720 [Catharanthus roseus]|uniref:Uncharacterized protein n=1 Tax=Catharanthus roseus TaxID=4058 RepID=A0ACC0AN36_CATRO|nr:hypothetical protein M9H77_21720 [Catharanthus roseus]